MKKKFGKMCPGSTEMAFDPLDPLQKNVVGLSEIKKKKSKIKTMNV